MDCEERLKIIREFASTDQDSDFDYHNSIMAEITDLIDNGDEAVKRNVFVGEK